MDNKNANRELVVVPMPDGSLQLEWGVAAGKTATSSVLLQQEIFTTYIPLRDKNGCSFWVFQTLLWPFLPPWIFGGSSAACLFITCV